MIIGIHHAAISTPDLERLRAFYCDLFGLEEVMRYSWQQGDQLCDRVVGLTDSEATFVYLRGGNAHLELFQYVHPVPRKRNPDWQVADHGITHICFEVDDIHAEFDRLVAAGMNFQVDAPIDARGMLHVAYGSDPDGNIVELVEFPDRAQGSGSASLTGAPLLSDGKPLR
ncbi:VOC family protein [Amycolatopsis ultiminotia]|uniref:VOC family protein n=1 Tax=Amycolatopsis ultiminotia TaxID=543629 RepID=A0ABP6W1M0_9PSEU